MNKRKRVKLWFQKGKEHKRCNWSIARVGAKKSTAWLHVGFVDLEKGFDRVDCKKFSNALRII